MDPTCCPRPTVLDVVQTKADESDAAVLHRAQLRFRAMGTDCHVLVVAPPEVADTLAGLAHDRVELLEQCWSRFRADSELNRLNGRAGEGPVPVSEDLLHLVSRMKEAWQRTDGLFDPTVLAAMNAHGYDVDFAVLTSRPAYALDDVRLAAVPGMSGVIVDRAGMSITLPAGIGLDPGAIGKGLAADIIADEIREAGATGVLVNLGGDIAISGADVTPWAIAVQDERMDGLEADRTLTVLHFEPGITRIGTATSTILKRRWAQGRRHHVIDPRTGTMGTSPLVQVTVVASTAWEAEALATAALLQEPARAASDLADRALTAILLTSDDVRTIPEVLLSPAERTHHDG